jgi:hypothetical protein
MHAQRKTEMLSDHSILDISRIIIELGGHKLHTDGFSETRTLPRA